MFVEIQSAKVVQDAQSVALRMVDRFKFAARFGGLALFEESDRQRELRTHHQAGVHRQGRAEFLLSFFVSFLP